MFEFLNTSERFIVPSEIQKELEKSYKCFEKVPSKFCLSSDLYDDFIKEVPCSDETPLGMHRRVISSFCEKYFKYFVPENQVLISHGVYAHVFDIKFIEKTENLFYTDGKLCSNFVSVPFTLPEETENARLKIVLICRAHHYVLSKEYESQLQVLKKTVKLCDLPFEQIPDDVFPYLSFIFREFPFCDDDFCKIYMKIPKQFFGSFFSQVREFYFYDFRKLKDFWIYLDSLGLELPEISTGLSSVCLEDVKEAIEKLGEKSWIILKLKRNISYEFMEIFSIKSMKRYIQHLYDSKNFFVLKNILSFEDRTVEQRNKIAEWRSLFRSVVLKTGISEEFDHHQICWIVHIVKVIPIAMIRSDTVKYLCKNQIPENKLYLLPCKLDARARDIVRKCPAYQEIFEDVEKCSFRKGQSSNRDDL